MSKHRRPKPFASTAAELDTYMHEKGAPLSDATNPALFCHRLSKIQQLIAQTYIEAVDDHQQYWLSCPQNCQAPSGGDILCTQCNPAYALFVVDAANHLGICLEECPAAYYKDARSGTCVQCPTDAPASVEQAPCAQPSGNLDRLL